jgi:protein-disulfide isomerase
MSKPRPADRPQDRRARREAQRATRRDERHVARRRGPSPIVLVTIGAVVLGLLVIGVAALQNRAPAALVQPSVTNPPGIAHDRELGSPGAPVTLEVWSDFQCPACRLFWTISEPGIVAKYVAPGQARLVYHDFPFLGQESVDAAVAARCADRQDAFWPYHDLLFANQGAENSGAFSRDRLLAMADLAGLDRSTFSACLDDPAVATSIQQEKASGESVVNGTPTLLVNGHVLPGYDSATIGNAIEAALGRPGPTPSAASGGASDSASASP